MGSFKSSFKSFALKEKETLTNLDLRGPFSKLHPSYADYDGRVDGDDFSVMSTIARGLVSTVYLARYNGEQNFVHLPDKMCLLKVMQKSTILPDNRVISEVARSEILLITLAQESPYIRPLLGVFETDQYIVTMFEWCPSDLSAVVAQHFSSMEYEPSIKLYAAQVLLALEHVHSCGHVYSDLKLENVLVRQNGSIYLWDMVNARKYQGMPMYAMCGAAEYMSPEMVNGQGYDFLTDVWSFGILVFELLTGEGPFVEHVKRGHDHLFRAISKVSKKDIAFPPDFEAHDDDNYALNMLQLILTRNPDRRLGVNDAPGNYKSIKAHRWFAEVNWDALRRGTVHPPIVPAPRHSTTAAAASAGLSNGLTPWQNQTTYKGAPDLRGRGGARQGLRAGHSASSLPGRKSSVDSAKMAQGSPLATRLRRKCSMDSLRRSGDSSRSVSAEHSR